jgi:hypothetical protein
MRTYILTDEEMDNVVAYLAGGPYNSTVRKVLSAWRGGGETIRRHIETLERLEAKRQ